MDDRGPDSAGVAVYRDPAPAGWSKLTLYSADDADWERVRRAREAFGAAEHRRAARAARRRARRGRRRRGRGLGAGAPSRAAGDERRPRDRDLQGGRPAARLRRARSASPTSRARTASATRGWRPRAASRRRARTRSRPATTSASCTTARSRTTTACAAKLRREGIEFQTENDTEVAAGYLTWRLREGASLEQALEGCLDDLDGFYTFLVGTADGFAVLRDPDRLQAGGARRDRRLGRDGVRVPRDRGAARRGRRAHLGAGAVGRLRVGEGARDDRVDVAAEVVDLAATSLRELNQRLHDLAGDEPVAARAGGSSTRTARTPSPAGSTRRSRSRSPGTSATTAPG